MGITPQAVEIHGTELESYWQQNSPPSFINIRNSIAAVTLFV